jgi:hypothetical protein
VIACPLALIPRLIVEDSAPLGGAGGANTHTHCAPAAPLGVCDTPRPSPERITCQPSVRCAIYSGDAQRVGPNSQN